MISAVLNKIRKGDPDNVTRWSDVVQKNTDTNLNNLEIPAVQFMIDLCLRRRGWIPVFLECLAGTPNLFQLASSADALDAPAVQHVLRKCLEAPNANANAISNANTNTNHQHYYTNQQQQQEKHARERCMLELVERLLVGLVAPSEHPNQNHGMHAVVKMSPLSLIIHVILPCLRTDHPSLHVALLLSQLATKHWKEHHQQSVVAEMLRQSLAEVEQGTKVLS
jgi:hypothetical protein